MTPQIIQDFKGFAGALRTAMDTNDAIIIRVALPQKAIEEIKERIAGNPEHRNRLADQRLEPENVADAIWLEGDEQEAPDDIYMYHFEPLNATLTIAAEG